MGVGKIREVAWSGTKISAIRGPKIEAASFAVRMTAPVAARRFFGAARVLRELAFQGDSVGDVCAQGHRERGRPVACHENPVSTLPEGLLPG